MHPSRRITLLALAAASLVASAGHGNERADPALAKHLAHVLAADAAQPDHFDAEVWLLSAAPKLERYVDYADERVAILQNVYTEAWRNGIDPDLVMAVIQIESAFDRFAVSRVGAQGLMQVMTFWRHEIGRPQDNLTEIETNVRYGTAILAHYLEVANSDLVDALARYNGSRGRLRYPELVLGAYRQRWQTRSSDELPLLQQSCRQYPLAACRTLTLSQ